MDSLASLDNNDNDNDNVAINVEERNRNHDHVVDETKGSGDDLNGNINSGSSNNNSNNNNNKQSNSNCSSNSSSSNCNSNYNDVNRKSLSLTDSFYRVEIPAIDSEKALPLIPLYLLPIHDIKLQLESLNKPEILNQLLKQDPNLAAVALEQDYNVLSKYFLNQYECMRRKIRKEKIRRSKIYRKLSAADPQRRCLEDKKIVRLSHFVVTHIIDRYLANIDSIFGYVINFFVFLFFFVLLYII